MNRYDFYRLLIILGLMGLDAFLVWALYSIIMTVVSGVSTLNAGTLVLGGILLYLFGGLIMTGILLTSIALVGFLFGG